MRLRLNRCLWEPPSPYLGLGCPRKHGDKFKRNYPHSWSARVVEVLVGDPGWGQLQVPRVARPALSGIPQNSPAVTISVPLGNFCIIKNLEIPRKPRQNKKLQKVLILLALTLGLEDSVQRSVMQVGIFVLMIMVTAPVRL